jgi:hypothetical protein
MPNTIEDIPIPELEADVDFIVAYSVFTHIAREEMHDLVGQLRRSLKPGGTLALTFIHPFRVSCPTTYSGNNLRWRLEAAQKTATSLDVTSLLEKARGAAWCALVDGTQLHVESDGIDRLCRLMTYHVFYTTAFLQQEFPDAKFLPPVNNEMQACCLLRHAVSAF